MPAGRRSWIDELEPVGTTRPRRDAGGVEGALPTYPFPGNVRELRWVLEHALAMADGGPIDASHLPAEVLAGLSLNRGP